MNYLGMYYSTTVLVLLFIVKHSFQTIDIRPDPWNINVISGEITRYKSYIQVKWQHPTVINSTIAGYTILYGRTDRRDLNKTVSVDAHKTSYKIEDLKPFTNFTVYVRVETKDGHGKWSQPSMVETPVGSTIKQCTITRCYSPSSTSIFVEWKPLHDLQYTNGVVIRWVLLTLDLIDGLQISFKQVDVPVNVLNQTVTGLKPHFLYQVIVLPETKRGFYILTPFLKNSFKIKTLEDVPSEPPANLSVTMLCQQYSLSIQWSPLSTKYRNGKLLGYNVLLTQDTRLYKNFTSTIEKTLISVDECKNYSAQVAAFTSPGVGKYSRVDVASSCPCGPPKPLYLRRTVVAKQGLPVSLPCEYYGRPIPRVSWKRKVGDDFYDEISNSLVLPSNGSLVLSNVQQKDRGLYACELNNTYGASDVHIRLIVAKDILVLHFSIRVASLKFQVEFKDKTSDISRQLKSNITRAVLHIFKDLSNVKSIEVKKLRPGSVNADAVLYATLATGIEKLHVTRQILGILSETLYQQMMAFDGLLLGNLTIQERPGSPRNVKILERKTSSLHVSWQPPEYHQIYRVTSYSVNHRESTRKDWIKGKTIPGKDFNILVENLRSSTKYEVVVVAHNEYGQRHSQIFTVKTKADLTVTIALAIVLPICILMIGIAIYVWRKQRLKQKTIEEQLVMEQREKEELERKKATMFKLEDLLDDGSNSLTERKWREIPRNSLEILGELGSGAFGEVKKAKLYVNGDTLDCAVKMLKSQASKQDIRDLVNELNIMATVGEHPNIVSLIGACSEEVPLWLIVKFAENGSLFDYLKSLESHDQPEINSTEAMDLSHIDKLKLAFGIASGMSFLEQKRCVHRDLAARNVLLGKNNQPMVSDFGLSRDVYESGQYEKTTGGKLPVRWMAIESLKDYVFTLQSDVWSFGIVLWEIETFAKIPYCGLDGFDILNQLRQGYRLEKPIDCSQLMYDIMQDCWRENPKERPKFKDLVDRFTNLLKDEGCTRFLLAAAEKESHSYDHVIIDKSFLIEETTDEDTKDKGNLYI